MEGPEVQGAVSPAEQLDSEGQKENCSPISIECLGLGIPRLRQPPLPPLGLLFFLPSLVLVSGLEVKPQSW